MTLVKRIRITVATVAIVSVGAFACSDSDDPGVTTPGATPEPTVVQVTPFPAPTVEGLQLTAPAKGYTVTFPQGWKVALNYGTIGNESLDVAFIDDAVATPVGAVRPSLVIGCVPVGLIPDPAEFAGQRATGLQSTLGTPGEQRELEVDGVSAVSVTYSKTIGTEGGTTESIRQTDIFFASEKCGFTLSLLSAPEDAERFESQLEEMLQTFRFIS